MSRFVHLLRTPDARYAIGAVVSWPIYGALCTVMLKMFDKHYGATARISWMVSYWVVYAIQKYGTFSAMSREAAFSALFAAVSLNCAAAPFTVRLGLEKIVLDAPPGFTDTTELASPRLHDLAETLTAASNRILVFALSDADGAPLPSARVNALGSGSDHSAPSCWPGFSPARAEASS